MKQFFVLIFSLLFSNLYSQTPVNFILEDACRENAKSVKWEVVDDYGNKLIADKNGCFSLQSGKEYFVATEYYRGDLLKIINFTYSTNAEEKKDTIINIHQVDKFHKGNSVNFEEGYFNCDKLCDGKIVDYYNNGGKRLKGVFKDGSPIGKLIYYKKDGSVCRVEKYNKKGLLRK